MKDSVILDIEVYPNYFLAAFKSLRTGNVVKVETFSTLSAEQVRKIRSILVKKTTVGFNSLRYDIPMLSYIMNNKPTTAEIYKTSKKLIEGAVRPYQLLDNVKYDHIDIMEPAPAVMVSLKGYGARIGSKRLWDLPYDPHKTLSPDEAKIVSDYCVNDLDTTIDLFNAIYPRLELREHMSKSYGIDLRSKSDAQIAEAVFVSELRYFGKAPELPSTYTITYNPPECILFETPELGDIFADIVRTKFTLNKAGAVRLPKLLSNRKIVIGDTTYKLGVGGLHSQEKKLVVVSNDKFVLRNADVASYYPSMILEYSWYPKHLGVKFLEVYRTIYNRRLEVKRNKDMIVSDSLKIVLNGGFGKLGSKYSKLYSPDLLLHITLTGQLMLLMLIEQLELHGIKVVSSNTDGVEYFCDRDMVALAETIIFDWELATGMTMEHGEYKALYARDVNNYCAVYDKEVKAKGIYTKQTLMKGRQCPIVFTAIRQYLFDGTPVEETINGCNDINEFVLSRTVKGGGVWRNEYLGKMVRWVWVVDGDTINYVSNGNKVPLSDGAIPVMNFEDGEIPLNIDRQRYIKYAVTNLSDMGVDYAR